MKYLRLGLLFGIVSLTGCSTPNSQWVGGLLGGSVDFAVNKLSPNKYMLEAKGAESVKKDLLMRAYNKRAQQLCAPGSYKTNDKMGTYQYPAMAGSQIFYYTGLKVTGIVTCQ